MLTVLFVNSQALPTSAMTCIFHSRLAGAGSVLKCTDAMHAGGDALASDMIWRAVRELAREKPLVATMGDVAASGGYYVSMGAPTVLAQPLTLTGSIGVVVPKFNAAGLFDKVHSGFILFSFYDKQCSPHVRL